VQGDVAAEDLRQLALQRPEELGLGDRPDLEREQRVRLAGALQRLAEGPRRHAGVLLDEREALQQRRGEHAAEVRHHRADHAAARRRMS
jgi:hypothetical protein